MIFNNIKIGDQFKELSSGRVLIVTELTEKGFKYDLDKSYSQKLANWPIQFGTIVGGEIYTKNTLNPDIFDLLYERVNNEKVSDNNNSHSG